MKVPRFLKSSRFRKGAALTLTAGLTLAAALWELAPDWIGDPMDILEKQTPVRTYADRNGCVFYEERTCDHQWRFPIPLERISPEVIRVILTAEDRNFYRHDGVDLPAACRAFFQNLRNGRIISGASTITMQLAGMSLPDSLPKRSMSRKFYQILSARALEKRYTKERILEEYLNRVPFGGKLYGIEAAAQFYFGCPAPELNLAEATMLCGLPQKPNKFRPDRHPDQARIRQRLILDLLVRQNVLDKKEADRIFREEPLRFRDFTRRASFERHAEKKERLHFLQQLKRHHPQKAKKNEIICTLDLQKEEKLRGILIRHRDRLDRVRDGAAVLLDTKTGDVLAQIGTLDLRNPRDGQVDAAHAVRSAGSTLKPFLYAEGIQGGLLVGETIVRDAPIRYQDYSPGNYDGHYRGAVRMEAALADSLNTPVIRLLAKLGENRVQTLFQKMRLSPAQNERRRTHGLSLALGSAGYTLLNLTNAYRVLGCGGQWTPMKWLKSYPAENVKGKEKVFQRGTAAMITGILRKHTLPLTPIDAAWKTGTSNGNRDAWCMVLTPEYTLGVWFGNKDGTPSDSLVGISAAAPCAGEILNTLYQDAPPPQWESPAAAGLETNILCVKSGLSATNACVETFRGNVVRGIPLARCPECGQKRSEKIRVLSPESKEYTIKEGTFLPLELTVDHGPVYWILNGVFIGDSETISMYHFSENHYIIKAIDYSGKQESNEIKFSVNLIR